MQPGDRVLIVKGQHSGRFARIAYVYWKSDAGYCQMEQPSSNDPLNFKKRYLVVPDFDHCGSPKIVDLEEPDVKFLSPTK